MKHVTERRADRIIAVFNDHDVDKDSVDAIFHWVKALAGVAVLAKIIYFCERMLSED